ncbi:MAG: SixA phosphatase family protein [Xanthomarina gelatinilytica]|uniref:SixA phosphatase family protein n=1 Tax=Xanthomarina gelatinilytica TaxID=1137281 RepID=UPI003A8B6D48
MKHISFLVACILLCFSCNQQEQAIQKTENPIETTTLYFIRHAEKERNDPTNKNPHLTEKGNARAENWSSVLQNIPLDAIYSTNYHRTIETAQPTARKNGLDINIYNAGTIDTETFLRDNLGKYVLIVGHSDTTPKFVNSVIGKQTYSDIDDSNNGNIYIVTITGNTITNMVLTIN